MNEDITEISTQEFLGSYKQLYNSIFEIVQPPEAPFKNKSWAMVLLPYGELMFSDIDFLP